MTYPLARLVSGPDPLATVRYDFNDAGALAPRYVTADFSLGAPALLTAPDAVSPAYGFRSISMGHIIRGSKSDALAALAVLSRELLRSTSWFLFQVDAFTRPVWFRVYSTSPEALSFEQVYVDTATGDPAPLADFWSIRATFTADAFGYGERVTLPSYAVVQGPADLTGPTRTAMRVLLPTIKGDAPTALRVSITPDLVSAYVAGPGETWMVGCVSGSAALDDPLLDIGSGDGLTALAGTGAGVSDAAYFDGSYRAVTVGTGANFLPRLSGFFPAAPFGRYKVLLRCEADAPSSTVTQYVFALDPVNGPLLPSRVVTVNPHASATAQTFRGWVDLGEVTIPFGATVPMDFTGDVAGSQVFAVNIGTADGSAGAVRLDALKLVPVGGRLVDSAHMLTTQYGEGFTALQSATTGTCDGDEEIWYTTVAGDVLDNQCTLSGGFPMADPASEENLLVVMALDRGTVGTSTPTVGDLNALAVVDVSYHPRVLHLDGRP